MRSAGVFPIEETMRGYFRRIYYFRHFTLHQFALRPPGVLASSVIETLTPLRRPSINIG